MYIQSVLSRKNVSAVPKKRPRCPEGVPAIPKIVPAVPKRCPCYPEGCPCCPEKCPCCPEVLPPCVRGVRAVPNGHGVGLAQQSCSAPRFVPDKGLLSGAAGGMPCSALESARHGPVRAVPKRSALRQKVGRAVRPAVFRAGFFAEKMRQRAGKRAFYLAK